MMERGALEKVGETDWNLFLDFMSLQTPCNDLLGTMEAKLRATTSAWSGDSQTHDALTPLCQELALIQDRLTEITDTMADIMEYT